ncbi:hypothetical protein MAUB_03140 [Mycolicibacterium aubagnense]|uniref:Uncharacterized protein n=1 Tax=Mycolicibacterium aubagnense TaxID=319707 RepID=A0ABN5YL66_9MYCO|nr:hypothetical protein MAUB_03140 [Mycolicibacterium aubagnense]
MNIDAGEERCQVGPVDLRPPHPERLHSRPLDEIEHGVTVLLANRVTEDGAEQANVFTHRLCGLPADFGALNRSDRQQRGVWNVGSLWHTSVLTADAGAAALGTQGAGVGTTIGVVVSVTVVTGAGGPAGTIGADDVVVVVSAAPDELPERDVVVDGCCPSGITIGVEVESPPP